jgi:flagellar biosynthesis/type III secretory pathway protein FliH
VRLGPFFAEAVDLISDSLQRKGIACTVLVDPRVGPQGCQLETELGRVDESVEARLDVLLSALDVVP